MLDSPDIEFAAASARLAALSPLAYDRQRIPEAKALGVRVSVLDAEVERLRKSLAPFSRDTDA
ncbi:MAG TPA: hypothetical protein VGC09_02895, partial [Rhodopila sp.]